jgi:phosphate:Na+ symporter
LGLPVTLMDLARSVALLLWRVHMVQTGVQRAFGARLRSFLGSALRNRYKAFLAGIGVTALQINAHLVAAAAYPVLERAVA